MNECRLYIAQVMRPREPGQEFSDDEMWKPFFSSAAIDWSYFCIRCAINHDCDFDFVKFEIIEYLLKTRRRAIVFRSDIVRNLPRKIKWRTIFASFVTIPLEIFLLIWNISKLKIHWKIDLHVECGCFKCFGSKWTRRILDSKTWFGFESVNFEAIMLRI